MAAIAFNGTWSQTQSATYASVTLTETYDSSNFHSNVTNPTRVTMPETGWYLLRGSGGIPANQGQYVRFLVDGTTAYGTNGQAATANVGAECLHVMCLDAGQYVELQHHGDNGVDAGEGVLQVVRLPTPLFCGTGSAEANVQCPFTEAVDNGNWHSDSVNPDRVTVDTTGNYMIMVAQTAFTATMGITVNGVQVHTAHNEMSFGSPAGGCTFIDVRPLNAGDYLGFICDTAYDVTTFAVALVDGVRLAQASQTVGLTVPVPQPALIPFDTELVDTTGFHDNVTNNSRITIPASNAGVYLTYANIECASTNVLQLRENGAGYVNRTCRNGSPDVGANNNRANHGLLGWVANLSPGDYFDTLIQCVPGFVTDILGTYIGTVCLDDFVYGAGCRNEPAPVIVYQRIYGIPVEIDDNGTETVRELLVGIVGAPP